METIDLKKAYDQKKLYPNFGTVADGLFHRIDKIDHPFLQLIATHGAYLVMLQGEFTLMAAQSTVMLIVREDCVEIECISTAVEDRGKGSATRVMEYLCEAADESHTILKLRTANVTGNGWNMPQHITVGTGMAKKGKIPVDKLPDWYAKFGFEKTGKVMHRNKFTGWAMVRYPK